MTDIFQTAYSNAFSWMKMFEFNTIWLNCFPKGLIDNATELVQIMAWRQAGNKPLSETTTTPAFWDTPRRRPMITHTSDSHQIPIQNKTKSKLQI